MTWQVLIVSLGSLAASTPYLAAILMSIIAVWITSARSLGGMIRKFETDEVASSTVSPAGKTSPPPKLAGARH